MRVLSPSGDYADDALVECYDASIPGVAVGAYQAQFVRYGALVYRYGDPVELGREILKLDPESMHAAASFVRMSDELLSKMATGSLEPESLGQVLEEEQGRMEEAMSDPLPEKPHDDEAPKESLEEGPVDEPASAPIDNEDPAQSEAAPPVPEPEPEPVQELEATTTPAEVSAQRRKRRALA